jgi:hypothetical protein
MTKKKTESVTETPEIVTPEAVTNTAVKTEFVVTNSSGVEVRTYSVDIHGEEAEKLANEYAGKISGKVI